ncbi:MAG: hypothetical protein ACOYCB_02340 [Fastidiosipilaceae bacterium]|jgi:hypothetical protein|nr:hypothetical protein [Clostridiaceae bacterium]
MRKSDKHRRERITTESAELSRQAYYVRSLAGHDKDQILLQCGRRGRFVLICDGGTRGLKQMKQKNPKHLAILGSVDAQKWQRIRDIKDTAAANAQIRKLIKSYQRREKLG